MSRTEREMTFIEEPEPTNEELGQGADEAGSEDESVVRASVPEKPVETVAEEETEESTPPPKPEPRRVPLSELIEERKKRQELQEQISRMEQRWGEFQKRWEDAQQPKEQIPDYDQDPGAHLLAKQRQMEEQLRKQQEVEKQRTTELEQQKQQTQFMDYFRAQETAYAKKTDDYYQAVDWLRNLRQEGYQEMGYSPEEAQHIVDWEAMSMAQAMSQRGLHGPEGFYNLAKRWGWQRAKKEPAPASKLEELKENIPRAKSLGPSGEVKERLSLSEIASLDEDEFEKVAGDPRKWEKLWK